jgi:hypothetical protein
MGVDFGVDRPNSDYIEFIEDPFWIFEAFESFLGIILIVEDISESVERVF